MFVCLSLLTAARKQGSDRRLTDHASLQGDLGEPIPWNGRHRLYNYTPVVSNAQPLPSVYELASDGSLRFVHSGT